MVCWKMDLESTQHILRSAACLCEHSCNRRLHSRDEVGFASASAYGGDNLHQEDVVPNSLCKVATDLADEHKALNRDLCIVSEDFALKGRFQNATQSAASFATRLRRRKRTWSLELSRPLLHEVPLE